MPTFADALLPLIAQEFPDISGLFQVPSIDEARGLATEQVGPYFDKKLEQALKTLEIARTRTTQDTETGRQRQAITEDRFMKEDDRNFAAALNRTQESFAGRDLYSSGFRNRAAGNLITEHDFDTEGTRIGFQQTSEDRERTFSRALEDLTREEEQTKFDLAMAKESSILQNIPIIQNAKSRAQGGLRDILRPLSQALS